MDPGDEEEEISNQVRLTSKRILENIRYKITIHELRNIWKFVKLNEGEKLIPTAKSNEDQLVEWSISACMFCTYDFQLELILINARPTSRLLASMEQKSLDTRLALGEKLHQP